MSEITEREKNEPLTARELEEEEMMEELQGMGMYEKGLTYKHMKDILRMVSESRDMAKKDANNKATQKAHTSYDLNSDMMYKPSSSSEIESQVHNEVPKPSYSYKATHTTPTKFDGNISEDSSGSDIFSLRDPINRHKNTNNVESFEEVQELPSGKDTYASVANKCMTLRSRTLFKDSQNSHISELKMDVQQDHSQRVDKGKVDPFNICADEKDVPLQVPKRPQAHEHMPFKLCRGAWTPEKLDQALAAMNIHLQEVSNMWRSRQRIINSSEFQWGSPIQVGVTKASVDRKLPVDAENVQRRLENANDKRPEQSGKRKVSDAIPVPCTSDNTDDNDLPSAKKKKLTVISTPKTFDSCKIIPNDSEFLNKQSQSPEFSDDDFEQSDTKKGQNVKLDRENRSMSPETKPMYPRRITPPNPARNVKIRQPKFKLKKPVYNRIVKVFENNLEKDQTEKTCVFDIDSLMQEDTDDDEKEIKVKPLPQHKNIEIKPLPMKNLSVRLEKQCTTLNRNRMNEEKCKLAKSEEEKRKLEEERKKREEMIAKRLKEYEDEQKEKEDNQRKQKLKIKQWDETFRLRRIENRSRRQEDKREENHLEKEEEERLLMDTDVETIEEANNSTESSISNVNCPICNKHFSKDEIEYHAAQCVQYSGADEHVDDNKKRSTRSEFVCFVCSFKASNCDEYNVHVSDCVVRQEDAAQGPSEITITDIPDSPIRSFRSISAVRNAEVDYKKQFKVETTMPRTKKRKR